MLSNSLKSEEEKYFYKWVPPTVGETKFNEMKHYDEIIKQKENSLNNSGANSSGQNKSNYSNTPPKQKDYLNLKKSKSQININKEKDKITEEISNKDNDNNILYDKHSELRREMKSLRMSNNQYFKKNQDLELKYYEISKAYNSMIGIFEKMIGFSKELINDNLMEKNRKEAFEKIEGFEDERNKIESYLKFKSIFSYRFSELIKSQCKNNFDEYRKFDRSLFI